MKVSELISALQDLQEEFGDLEAKAAVGAADIVQVYLCASDEDSGYYIAIDTAD